MPTEHERSTGYIVVCIEDEAVSAISPGGEVVDDDRGDELRRLLNDSTRLRPLFRENQSRLRREAAELRPRFGPAIPDLSRFYRIETDDQGRQDSPEAFAEELAADALVQAAYFKPPHQLPNGAEPPLPTPEFSDRQEYLGPAPTGVDASYAWSLPGGHGEGVQIIDVENAWRFTHEDLVYNQGGVLNTPPDDLEWRNHGTSVVGILGGDLNSIGITGICPSATVSGISVEGEYGGSAEAIARAADKLRPGDIMLIELHTAGPLTGTELTTAEAHPELTLGFLPIEIWPDDFAAVKYATNQGVVVVAAAGNGRRDLGSLDQLTAVANAFDPAWASPFKRDPADSGAIFVGAGAPPGDARPDRSRLDFSNWGTCVDAQGWGKGVVTTGGVGAGEGNVQGGPYEDRWYNDRFSGTSSAAAIVAGTLGCVQGVLRAAGHAPLTPAQARALLRASGSPQVASEPGGALESIGSRPNLRELIPQALASTGPAVRTDDIDYPYSASGGQSMTILMGGCGCGPFGWGGPHWGGPHWGGPHWGGPHWGGPHWGGPHWGGPHWGGQHWGGPHWGGPHWGGPHWGGPHWRGSRWFDPGTRGGPFSADDPLGGGASSRSAPVGRRGLGRPGF